MGTTKRNCAARGKTEAKVLREKKKRKIVVRCNFEGGKITGPIVTVGEVTAESNELRSHGEPSWTQKSRGSGRGATISKVSSTHWIRARGDWRSPCYCCVKISQHGSAI